MKRRGFILLLTLFIIFQTVNICLAETKVCGEYTAGSLKIISYSSSWDSGKLAALYKELLNNFYGDELAYLGEISLYPNSPNGVDGYYYQDITLQNGRFMLGKNAKIALYNCERHNTVEKIAGNLSHEYGHHYTTVNIFLTEGKLYNEEGATKYYEIRELDKYPVVYSYSDPNYSYAWDIGEILASDYVQLLGSPNAKRSVEYLDSAEKLIYNRMDNMNYEDGFNLNPQINPYLPLAAHVKGLYTYMLSISGYTAEKKALLKAPAISSIEKSYLSSIGQNQYAVYWDRAMGNSPFEYTVIMYPSNNPFTPIPIKTVSDGEALKAFFGSAVLNLTDGTRRTYTSRYTGEYIFKVYAKDSSGFIYSSAPYYYNFDDTDINTDKSESTEKKSFWKSLFERNR